MLLAHKTLSYKSAHQQSGACSIAEDKRNANAVRPKTSGTNESSAYARVEPENVLSTTKSRNIEEMRPIVNIDVVMTHASLTCISEPDRPLEERSLHPALSISRLRELLNRDEQQQDKSGGKENQYCKRAEDSPN